MLQHKQKLAFQGILSQRVLTNRINFLVRRHKKTNRELVESCNQVKQTIEKIQTKSFKINKKDNFNNSTIIDKKQLLKLTQSNVESLNFKPYPYITNTKSLDRNLLSQINDRNSQKKEKYSYQTQQQPQIDLKIKIIQQKKQNYKEMKLKFQENQKFIEEFKKKQIMKKKIQKMTAKQQSKINIYHNLQEDSSKFQQFQQERRFLNLQEALRMIQLKKKLVTQEEKQLKQYQKSLIVKQNLFKALHNKNSNKENLKIKQKNHHLSPQKSNRKSQNLDYQSGPKQHLPEVNRPR